MCSVCAFLRRMATRVSSSGAWMSATSPQVKRELRRSSIRSSCCGYLSLLTTKFPNVYFEFSPSMGGAAACRPVAPGAAPGAEETVVPVLTDGGGGVSVVRSWLGTLTPTPDGGGGDGGGVELGRSVSGRGRT